MSLTQLRSRGILDGTITAGDFASGVGGKVLQVVQVTKTDTFTASLSIGSFTDITGLSVSITPSSASNKILVFAKVDGGGDATDNRPQYYRLLRDSTLIGSGVNSSSRLATSFGTGVTVSRSLATCSTNFLDSPATTSSTTYKIQVGHESSSTGSIFINRGNLDDDLANTKRGISIIIVMEIAA